LWDVDPHNGIGKTWIAGGGAVLAVAFSPNGKLLLTTGENSSAQLWSVASQRPAGKPIGRSGGYGVISAVFSPNGKLLGTVGPDQVRVWSVATQKRVGKDMNPGVDTASGVAFTPDGAVIVSADRDGTIRQWSLATRHQIGPVIAPKGRHVFGVEAISPDGKLLATTELNDPAHLWVLREG
jgi:WD40 repeat protein